VPDQFDPEIEPLLRQDLPADVREFAGMLLYRYRDEALAIARTAEASDQKRRKIGDARERLRLALLKLLAWAKETGRM
jgi:hypothetical protein